jgi:hypothetical protein
MKQPRVAKQPRFQIGQTVRYKDYVYDIKDRMFDGITSEYYYLFEPLEDSEPQVNKLITTHLVCERHIQHLEP